MGKHSHWQRLEERIGGQRPDSGWVLGEARRRWSTCADVCAKKSFRVHQVTWKQSPDLDLSCPRPSRTTGAATMVLSGRRTAHLQRSRVRIPTTRLLRCVVRAVTNFSLNLFPNPMQGILLTLPLIRELPWPKVFRINRRESRSRIRLLVVL